jgi:hypothetical protein
MARPKKRSPAREKALAAARSYLNQHMPEMKDAPLMLNALDAPEGAPCFAISATRCAYELCPHHISPRLAAAGKCPVLSCPLRKSVRLLLNAENEIVQATRGPVRWR